MNSPSILPDLHSDHPNIESGKRTRRLPFEVGAPLPPPVTISLKEARADVEDAVWQFAEQHYRPKMFPVTHSQVITAPPGTGKTTASVEAIAERVREWPEGRFIYVARTHQLLCEVEARFAQKGVAVTHIRGRADAEMCAFPEVAKQMHRLGLDMGQLICNARCPNRTGCPYFAQWEGDPRRILLTPKMFLSKRLQFDAKTGRPRTHTMLVFDDVDALEVFVSKIAVTSDTLLRASARVSDEGARDLLRSLATVVSTAKAGIRSAEIYAAVSEDLGAKRLLQIVDGLQRNRISGLAPQFAGGGMPHPERDARCDCVGGSAQMRGRDPMRQTGEVSVMRAHRPGRGRRATEANDARRCPSPTNSDHNPPDLGESAQTGW